MKPILSLAGALLLAACVNGQPSAINTVATLQTGYDAAVGAEIAYETSGKADVAIVKQIETYRIAADSALKPLRTAAETGADISAASISAAQAVLADLTSYLTTQGLMKGAS